MIISSPPLLQVVYSSVATRVLVKSEIEQLMRQSRARNEAAGITGMLVSSSVQFLQVLEGPEPAVSALYDRISRDPRHKSVRLISECFIRDRQFPGWSMGYANLADIPGLNDFFADGECLAGVDPGRAKTILKGFRTGAYWV